MLRKLTALLAAAAAAPAAAEVKSADAHGFSIENRATVPAPPAAVWASLVRIGEWWNPEHSHSGKSANLALEPRAGGCFCERLPADGGSVEHMRVVLARPGKMLRMHGGLGPLQGEGVAGALTWELKPAAGGTEIVQSYVVGGRIRGGAEAFARPVDGVLAEQLQRLSARFAR